MKKLLILPIVVLLLFSFVSCSPKLNAKEQGILDLWNKYIVDREEAPKAVLVAWNEELDEEDILHSMASSTAKVCPRYDEKEDIDYILDCLSNENVKAEIYDPTVSGDDFYSLKTKYVDITLVGENQEFILTILIDYKTKNKIFVHSDYTYFSRDKRSTCICFDNYINGEEFINNLPEE